jgi:hypothetical protein
MARVAQEFFSQADTFPYVFRGRREELVVINDGTADLTFTAGAITFVLKPGETFDEEINPFYSINVVATGSFRGFVRESY